jgi:hypothetical protein
MRKTTIPASKVPEPGTFTLESKQKIERSKSKIFGQKQGAHGKLSQKLRQNLHLKEGRSGHRTMITERYLIPNYR